MEVKHPEQVKTSESKEKEVRKRFLSFLLKDELYGIDILQVQEIIQLVQVTRIPRVVDYISGVINLRGQVIPVLDLRKRFKIESNEKKFKRQCIIVVHVKVDDNELLFGLKVDEISEVQTIITKDIQTPSLNKDGKNISSGFIKGMGILGEKVMTILDTKKVVSKDGCEDSDEEES